MILHVIIWAGVTSRPYLFDNAINQDAHLGMLQDLLVPQLENLGVKHDVCTIPSDGAPEHCTVVFKEYLIHGMLDWSLVTNVTCSI